MLAVVGQLVFAAIIAIFAQGVFATSPHDGSPAVLAFVASFAVMRLLSHIGRPKQNEKPDNET